jgi:hypothetical protein
MKYEAKLMKNLRSSDINTMLQRSMNVPVARLQKPRLEKPRPEKPLITALIWGLNISPAPDTAIWGTAPVGGTNHKQNFTAIWGTLGTWAPQKHAGTPLPTTPWLQATPWLPTKPSPQRELRS